VYLVLGATGGFGGAVVRELRRRGLPVRAFVRSPSGLPGGLPAGVETVTGDATDRDALARAMEGTSAVFNGVSVPLHRWDTDLRRVQDAVLSAVEATGPLLVTPSTTHSLKPIYGVALPPRAPLTESVDRPSRLAQIRTEIEMQIEQDADLRGVRSVLLRACDWFGPGVRSGVCAEMAEALRTGRPIPWYGGYGHAFSNVTDAASIAVQLALLPGELPALERRLTSLPEDDEDEDGEYEASPAPQHPLPTHSRFYVANVTSHVFESADDWAAAITRATGKPTTISTTAAARVRLRALWSAEARAFTQVLRPWEAVVSLDDSITRSLLPAYTPQPLDEGLTAWIDGRPAGG
jgi:nucleoside-diphosphate-sugar epimerase